MMTLENPQAETEQWPPHGGDAIAVPAENEVHVWRAALDVAPEKLAEFESSLQSGELERAARFRFPEHRVRFIAARGILRKILGIHLGCAPAALRFTYGEHGKPRLAEPAESRMEFNVSHSRDLALYAVATGRRVGVDVEFIKPDGSWLRIAEQYFTATEAGELAALPEETMKRKFFELWSVKEARLKAVGAGLRALENAGEFDSWPVVKLNPAAGYAAALAYEALGMAPVIVKHHYMILTGQTTCPAALALAQAHWKL